VTGYFYRPKSPKAAATDVNGKASGEKIADSELKPSANKMANLLSCLKADDKDKEKFDKFIGHTSDLDEDEDVSNTMERRVSMNQYNGTGLNFQKYQDIKPSAGVRREILNMFNEYKEMGDKKHAMDEF